MIISFLKTSINYLWIKRTHQMQFYIIQQYFTLSFIFISFDFNFALDTELSWGSISGLDRAVFQSEESLIDTYIFICDLDNQIMRCSFQELCWISMGRIDKSICRNTWYITTSTETMHVQKDFLNSNFKHIFHVQRLHECLAMCKFVFMACKMYSMFPF